MTAHSRTSRTNRLNKTSKAGRPGRTSGIGTAGRSGGSGGSSPARGAGRARRAGALTAASAVLAAAGSAAPAQAAAPSGAPTAGQQHCIAAIGGGPQRCFATYTEAIDAASGGQVSDAPASGQRAARDRGLTRELRQLAAAQAELPDIPPGNVIQGTFFEHVQYGGATLTIYGSGPCPTNGKVDYSYDLTDWWKDRISSVQPWANCWLWLYPEPDLGGDRDGPFKENTPDIGPFMNDRTESIGFS